MGRRMRDEEKREGEGAQEAQEVGSWGPTRPEERLCSTGPGAAHPWNVYDGVGHQGRCLYVLLKCHKCPLLRGAQQRASDVCPCAAQTY